MEGGKRGPVTEALLGWYDANAREMPWRGIHDPWGTWVSEIMLQQTRVDTARDYYIRFMRRFPTVRDLAEAPEADVLKMWEGLGYYSRARNLRQGAIQVMTEYNGKIPETPEELIRIRGIGPYTSCSIASIAFRYPVAAVDGNVTRVVCRLYDIADNPAEAGTRDRIAELAGALVPADRPGDHNQAMMDLGATVCVPGTPDCENCPLREMCAARAAGTAETLPRLPKARPPQEIAYDLPVIFAGNSVLLYRRGEKMLHGLWCFPLMEGCRSEEELTAAVRKKLGLRAESLIPAGSAKHVFTHQVWRMNLYRVRVAPDSPAPEGYEWIPVSEMDKLAFPTAVKAARALVKQGTPDEK